jgi:hypothetical protein
MEEGMDQLVQLAIALIMERNRQHEIATHLLLKEDKLLEV